jgi:hypothetical protein
VAERCGRVLRVEATHGCTPSPTCAFDLVRQDRSVAASETAGLPRRRWIVRWWRWWLLRAEPVPHPPEHDEPHDGDDQNAAGYPPGDAHINEITVLCAAGTRFRTVLDQVGGGPDQR